MGALFLPKMHEIKWLKIPHPGRLGKQKKYSTERDLDIYRLRWEGRTVDELAVKYELSKKRIWGILKEIKDFNSNIK